jgi:hypothetical protein
MPLSSPLVLWAAREGHLDCLRYAHQHGAVMKETACLAATHGHLDCLEYAHEHGSAIPADALAMDVASPNHVACLEYLWKHRESLDTRLPMRTLVRLLRDGDEWKRNLQRLEGLYVRYETGDATHKDLIDGLCDAMGKPTVLHGIRQAQEDIRQLQRVGRACVARHLLLPTWRRACAKLRIALYWRRVSKRYVHKLKRAVAPIVCEVSTEWHKPIVAACMRDPMAGPFRKPLDWRALGLWDYPSVVTHPMDLSTMRHKTYRTMDALRADFALIWDNADAYNGTDSWIYAYTQAMRRVEARECARLATCGVEVHNVHEVSPPVGKRARLA